MKSLLCFLFLSVAAGASSATSSGGSSTSSSSSSGGAAQDTLGVVARQELASCRNGTNDTAFDDAIEVTGDMRESCHELVVCGGIGARLVLSIVEIFIRAAKGMKDDTGLTFDADSGVYRTAPGSVSNTQMDFTLSKDGTVLKWDLRALESYFVGGNVTITGTTADTLKVKVSYEGFGPAFGLLGIDAPPGPAEVTLEAAPILDALGAVVLRAKTSIDDKQGHARFYYATNTPDTTLRALVTGDPMAFSLDSLDGEREDVGQTIATTTFQVSYVGGAIGALDGTIAFDVKGGPMPYKASFAYPKDATPKVTFACP